VGDLLLELDQGHLFAHWPAAGEKDAEKKRFLAQVASIEDAYIGGVRTYVSRAKQLLRLAVQGANPYEGFRVKEPTDAVRIETPQDFHEYESKGMQSIARTAFVLVAGGLGERLGYKGIKLALPSEITSETCYLELYARWILALQSRARVSSAKPNLLLQLAIMTSDDTDASTRVLLERHNFFGLERQQVTLFKQGKVPSLLDNDAHFTLDERDPFTLDTKPHGHGDVHALLYGQGIVERWVKTPESASALPIEWITFFQDTNGLVFHALVAALGVSVSRSLHMNSLTVPRAQGDAVGAICTLERERPLDEKQILEQDALPNTLTINVEYNQLEGLLGKGVREPVVPGTNSSVYPGNINVLILKAPDYFQVLQEKKGQIAEFVNPKYNADKTSFKKPTRLECMMQDYPKLLTGKVARVGFTQFQRLHAFSAVKNSLSEGVAKVRSGNAPEVAASGESDQYGWCVTLFRQAGATVDVNGTTSYKGIEVPNQPHLLVQPSMATTQQELLKKIEVGAKNTHITSRSSVVLDGENIRLGEGGLKVDGCLILLAHPQAEVTINNLTIRNDGWQFEEIPDGAESAEKVEQKYQIRGYTLKRVAQTFFHFDQPGRYTLSDATAKSFEKEYTNHPARRRVN